MMLKNDETMGPVSICAACLTVLNHTVLESMMGGGMGVNSWPVD